MAKRTYRRTFGKSKRRPASQAVRDGFQSKMKLGEPGDSFEKEADRMANQVVNKPGNKDQVSPAAKVSPLGQTKKEEDKKEEVAQAKGSTNVITVAPPVAKTVHKSKGEGQKMPANTRHFMEARFGADFGEVKIHTDQRSTWMNKKLKAQAFTHGQDVYFNEGKFKPESRSGKHLLAHELTHVIQQGKAKPKIQKQTMDAGVPDAGTPDVASGPRDAGVPAGVPSTSTAPAPATPAQAMPAIFAGFSTVNASTTPAGMLKRIPPRVTTSVNVVVMGWQPPMRGVEISVDNAGGGNGTATLNGQPTVSMFANGTINLVGQTQTAPGKANNLRLVARQGPTVLAKSNPFSVAAIPQNWNGSILRKVKTGPSRGIIIADRWESDSKVTGDLSQVWISEEVETKFSDGIYAGAGVSTSGYLGPSTSFTTDSFTTPVRTLTGPGSAVDDQTSIFWDKRTGSKDIKLKNSGYRIIEVVVRAAGKIWQQITRKGKNTTANGHTSEAGGGNIDGGIIEV